MGFIVSTDSLLLLILESLGVLGYNCALYSLDFFTKSAISSLFFTSFISFIFSTDSLLLLILESLGVVGYNCALYSLDFFTKSAISSFFFTSFISFIFSLSFSFIILFILLSKIFGKSNITGTNLMFILVSTISIFGTEFLIFPI